MQLCCVNILHMKVTRNTVAKGAILDLITNSDSALSHSEIHKLTQDLCDRVTIYRILDRLVNEDVIHKIVNLDGTIKYAKCHHENHVHIHNHVHFSCEKCLKVTCMENVQPSYIIPRNYKVNDVNFTLSGLCPNCL